MRGGWYAYMLLPIVVGSSIAVWHRSSGPEEQQSFVVESSSLQSGPDGTVHQAFSPTDDLERLWVAHIQQAQKTIHIACFGLSNPRIAAALEQAAQRGVEVIILEDHRQAMGSADRHTELAQAGCHIIIKRSRTLLHDKFGVFDGTSAIVGSYNLSESAEDQDNSVVVFDNLPQLVHQDELGWEVMYRREVGRPYRFGDSLPAVIPTTQ